MRKLLATLAAVAALVAVAPARAHYADDWLAGAHCYPPNAGATIHLWGLPLSCEHDWELTYGWCWDDNWRAYDGLCWHPWQDHYRWAF